MSAEEWRPIPGYDGYEVSDQGRVRSYKNNRWGITAVPRLLSVRDLNKPHARTTYRTVRITSNEGRYLQRLVHQLVLTAFIGPCPAGQVVRHLNGDGSDNRLRNLCYGTQSENGLDAVRHGLNVWANRTHCGAGHLLEGANLGFRSENPRARLCLECQRLRDRARRQTKKSAA